MTENGGPTSQGILSESSRIGKNVVALVFSRFVCLLLSLVQAGVIFRALGVEGSGQFGFALNYPALFTVFATLGIQRLLVRDIARDPSTGWTQLWTGVGVTSVLSVLVTAVIMGSIFVIESNPATRAAVFMATLSVIVLWAVQRPFEAFLQAHERMASISWINAVAGVARLGSVYWLLHAGPTSAAAHGGIAAGNVLSLILYVGATVHVAGWARPRFRLSLAAAQIRESMPFTFAVLFSMIYFKSDMSILKWLDGESAAGIYTAPQRLMEPLFMIAGICGVAIFPALCRFSTNAVEKHAQLMKTSARLTLMLAFPLGFGVGFLAEPVMNLLTGDRSGEFAESVTVLRILCLVTPFFYLNSIGQEFLYSSHRNWLVSTTYGVASVLSVAGNMVLIPWLSAAGAAWTAVGTNALISAAFVAAMWSEYGGMGLGRLVTKTVAASTAMGVIAYVLAPVSLALSVGAGGVAYLALQWGLGTLDQEERQLVLRMVRTPFVRDPGAD